jgi:arsenate reductase-like glutaredoxin family protein
MASIIQIFGVKKCQDTNKALRFFKERTIKIQFIDLAEKAISKGELESISRKIPLNNLIDIEGKQFKSRNLSYIIHDTETELLNDPLLFKTPVTRFGQEAAVGLSIDIWKKWINTLKDKK